MPTILKTERLIARTWQSGDLESFFAICSDPRVMKFVGEGQLWSMRRASDFIGAADEMQSAHGFCRWALIHSSDATLIGFCGFIPRDEGAEVGWRLAHDYWGQGLATEIAQAVLKYGFDRLGFRRVIATVQRPNVASKRVVEKLGMTSDGSVMQQGIEIEQFSSDNMP